MASFKAASQRNALVALSRFLVQDRVGGVLGPALEMLVQVLRARGGIAYESDGRRLDLVAEVNLPRRAKPWLAHLPIDDDPWFVVQRVARTKKAMVDAELAAPRAGIGIRPALEEAGWKALCAAPIRLGRRVHGVIVIAASDANTFDQDTLVFLESVGGFLGLAREREAALTKERERRLDEGKTVQLATLGLVADAVARDLSTPLGSLSMQLDSQAERLPALRAAIDEGDSALARQLLEHFELVVTDANEALRRAQNVASRLLALGSESAPEPLELALTVRETATMIATELEGRGIELEVRDDGDDELWVEGRLESLQMMFVQLLIYAAEQCEQAKVGSPRIAVRLRRDEGRAVVEIEASGRGEMLATSRVFDRLMGRSGHGSLGLELARQTIRAHDGHVELGTSEGGAVNLAVVLPLSARHGVVEDTPSLPPRASPPGEIPMIVWVDDDAAFVRAMCRNIQHYRAHVAGSVQEARELFARLPTTPELILCDVNLPDGLGTTVHAEAPAALAERFVFITGALLPGEVARYLKASGCPTLIKPIRTEEIYAVLDEQGTGRRPSLSRTLGSSRPPGEGEAPDLEDARTSFTGPEAGDHSGQGDQGELGDPGDRTEPDEDHRDSFNDAQVFGGVREGEQRGEARRQRRTAPTPPSRPSIPGSDPPRT